MVVDLSRSALVHVMRASSLSELKGGSNSHTLSIGEHQRCFGPRNGVGANEHVYRRC